MIQATNQKTVWLCLVLSLPHHGKNHIQDHLNIWDTRAGRSRDKDLPRWRVHHGGCGAAAACARRPRGGGCSSAGATDDSTGPGSLKVLGGNWKKASLLCHFKGPKCFGCSSCSWSNQGNATIHFREFIIFGRTKSPDRRFDLLRQAHNYCGTRPSIRSFRNLERTPKHSTGMQNNIL